MYQNVSSKHLNSTRERAQLDRPRVSVVICAYTEERWATLCEALASLEAQTQPPHEVIVVVDHAERLQERVRTHFPDVQVVANQERRGLSGARNSGVRHAVGDVVAFLDDDARADPNWLAGLVAAYDRTSVVGTGGEVVPRWSGSQPAWLPAEFYWVVGCSYEGLPREPSEIRNPLGANMSFRREVIERVGGFTQGIGRIGTTPLGCEETELAIRVRRETGGGLILYLPDARAEHLVTPARTTWRYFRSRCWSEGLSKALVTSHVGKEQALATERGYAIRTLPRGVVRNLVALARGDAQGLLRAGAIVAGLAITAAGYIRGRMALVWGGSSVISSC